MTGICYFTERPTEYLAEMQVDAVVRYTEDDSVTLKMEGNFSPEKADKLIEKAISDRCDNLVFITENKNVNILNRLIPQEYGKYFENITVLEENYDRLTESDAVAGAAPQGQNVAPAQGTNTQVNQTGTENTAATEGDKVIFICNAAAPDAGQLNAFMNERNEIIKSNPEYQNAETWFCNVDNAGLTAANILHLYENHPSDVIRQSIKLAKISAEGFDANPQDLLTMALSSKTVQSGNKYTFILPSSMNIQSPKPGVVDIVQMKGDFENKNNKAILPLISEVAKMIQNPKAEIKKRNDVPQEEEEFNKQFKKDEAKIKFIIEYAKAFEWWTKNKDKRLKTKEAKSQFAKAVEEFVFADFKNAWNSLKNDSDKGIQFMARSIDNMVKGIANDIKSKKNNNKTDKESKKEETNSRNIFSWEKYSQLCKLLFNN